MSLRLNIVVLSHMQREKSRDRFVVANGVAHVTAVKALRDPCGPTKPRGKTSLQRRVVGRHGGTRPAETPQDSVCPSRFPLLSADRQTEKLVSITTTWSKLL